MTRRQLLTGLLAAAGAAACGPVFEITREGASEGVTDGGSQPSRVELEPTPSPPASERADAAFAPYDPPPSEALPAVKRLAGRFVQSLGTYGPGADPGDIVSGAATRAHPRFALGDATRQAALMIAANARSRAEIRYPQLGGLDPHSDPRRAAVMVVVRQHIERDNGDTEQVTRTVDVRLARHRGEWVLRGLASVGGRPVPRPDDLPRAAAAVLDDNRIDLPDSARWDIHAGAIDDRVLVVMRRIADVFPYAVTVLRTGHPRRVFGGDVVSNHTVGRAVDIWSVDGTPVIEQNTGITYETSQIRGADRRRPAFRITQRLLTNDGVPELGSPWNLDPPGQPSFTDPVHADHLHVAFTRAE